MESAVLLGMTGLSEQELLEIVRRARSLLSDSGRWSARHYAESADGQWAPVGSERAQRFNLEGALVHAAGADARSALPAILDIFRAIDPDALARLKTTSRALPTHSEALALLDAAVAYLTLRAARKQSGTHRRVVLADVEPPNKKTSGS